MTLLRLQCGAWKSNWKYLGFLCTWQLLHYAVFWLMSQVSHCWDFQNIHEVFYPITWWVLGMRHAMFWCRPLKGLLRKACCCFALAVGHKKGNHFKELIRTMVFNYGHHSVLPDLIQFVSSMIKKFYAPVFACLSEMSKIILFNFEYLSRKCFFRALCF